MATRTNKQAAAEKAAETDRRTGKGAASRRGEDDDAKADEGRWNNARPDSRPAANQTPSNRSGYATIRLPLPVWFLKKIDEEAELLSYRSRADLLAMLIKRHAGLYPLERPAQAPKVVPPDPSEMGPDERYAWNCPKAIHGMLVDLCDRLGGVSPKAVIMMLLREYWGLPAIPSVGASAVAGKRA